jgi:hypothetical protein
VSGLVVAFTSVAEYTPPTCTADPIDAAQTLSNNHNHNQPSNKATESSKDSTAD